MPLVSNFSMSETDQTRFHTKYEKTENCWNWTASCVSGGYGAFRLNGKTVLAHKISLFLSTGKYFSGQDDLIACHRCKQNTKCVNPAHLDWDTYAKNTADRKRDGTQYFPKGEKHGGVKLTEVKVLEIRQKYATGKYLQLVLATDYDVSRGVISGIINRKTWTHI